MAFPRLALLRRDVLALFNHRTLQQQDENDQYCGHDDADPKDVEVRLLSRLQQRLDMVIERSEPVADRRTGQITIEPTTAV